MKKKNVPIIRVFLRSTALPRPLKIPSKVNAIELNGCAIITIQKMLLKIMLTFSSGLNNLPIYG